MYNKYLDSKISCCLNRHYTQEIIMSQFETPKLPEVKFNKNGYEIRTDILAMAKDMLQTEHSTKFAGWEMTAKRDDKTNQIVTTVGMPEFPGLDKVLETAERMYAFVNSSSSNRK